MLILFYLVTKSKKVLQLLDIEKLVELKVKFWDRYSSQYTSVGFSRSWIIVLDIHLYADKTQNYFSFLRDDYALVHISNFSYFSYKGNLCRSMQERNLISISVFCPLCFFLYRFLLNYYLFISSFFCIFNSTVSKIFSLM